MNEDLAIFLEHIPAGIPGFISGLIAAFAAWLVARTPKAGSREQAQINELQEDLAGLRNQVEKLVKNLEARDATISAQVKREYEWRRYVWDLQRHILAGNPPPPPAIPTLLSL